MLSIKIANSMNMPFSDFDSRVRASLGDRLSKLEKYISLESDPVEESINLKIMTEYVGQEAQAPELCMDVTVDDEDGFSFIDTYVINGIHRVTGQDIPDEEDDINRQNVLDTMALDDLDAAEGAFGSDY